MIAVRPAKPADAAEWARMREALWPADAGEPSEHVGEIARFFAGDLHERLASAAAHQALGFTETAQILCFRKDL